MSAGPSPARPTIRQLCLQVAVARECGSLWEATGIEASAFVRAVHLPDANRAARLIR
jgi:hypothetical protein